MQGKQFAVVATVLLLLLFAQAGNAFKKVRDEGIKAEAPLGEYIGSGACRECHEDKYGNWSQKHMSQFVRYKKDIADPLPSDRRDSPIPSDDVLLLVGGKKKMAFVARDWTVFPFQYHLKKEKWIKTNRWRNQDYRSVCGPCHAVGMNPETQEFVELNVGCESCHGPGRKHAGVPEKHKLKVPGKTDGADVLSTCRRCHNERQKHARPIKKFDGVFHD